MQNFVCDKARVTKVWVGKKIEKNRVKVDITPTIASEHYRQDIDVTVALLAGGKPVRHKIWDDLTVGNDNNFANKMGVWVAMPSGTKRPVAEFSFSREEYARLFDGGAPQIELVLDIQ